MLNKETGAYESIKTSKDPIFNYNLWEPGYTDVKFLKVENEGSLSLKWKAMFVSDAEVSKLAEVIDVWVKPSVTELAYSADRESISAENGWRNVGTLDQFINTLSKTTYGNLLPYSCAYLGIALHMQESAGNDYQEIGLEAFDIQIVATQMSNEEDSFGPDYDNDAQWPESGMNFSATQSLAGVSIINNELAEDVIIRHESGAYAIVPAGVKLADGVTELKFSGKGVDNAGNFDDETKSYDIHIEGIADDNEKSITVFIGQILEAGLGETELKLYHEDAQMTRVNSVDDFATYDQFTYDAATGAVVLYVKNFSVFSAVNTSADTWDGTYNTSWYNTTSKTFTLTTAEQFAGFRAIVDGGYYTVADGVWTWHETAQDSFDGKTVKFGADINLMNILFDPIGFGYESASNKRVFKGTFDGQGYSIYNLKQNGWDLDPNPGVYDTYTYSTAGAGLFASVADATIKNLTINGADIVFECVDMGILVGYAYGTCNFENIIVTNSKIANYNRYTGGVVGEVNGTHTFNNIIVDTSVKISALWGTFDPAIGGVIGGKWGDAKVSMTNVTVAAELDVYSDVTAAYQWYAYRRCGMLIGQTEMSDPTNPHLAYAPFLSCENVKVYYGDWVNYTYYKYDNQDDAWRNNYPWVRAEAGEHNAAYGNARYGVPVINGKEITDGSQNTGIVEIPFNQLYGGGQGVYGQSNHEGVERIDKFTKTIYFKNEWQWSDVRLYYWYEDTNKDKIETWHNAAYPGVKMTWVANDGTYDYYKFDLPAYVDGFKITDASTLDANGVAPDDKKTPDIHILDVEDNEMFYPFYNGSATEKYQVKSEDYADYCAKFTVIYLTPDSNWKQSKARFAAYVWTSTSPKVEAWFNMTDKDGDGTYVCWIPKSSNYVNIIFCRMNPNGTDNTNGGNNWNNRWNQTGDLKIPTNGNNRYTIKTGSDWNNTSGSTWSKK